MSLPARLYRSATGLIGHVLPRILESRVRAGKEDPERLNERLAFDLVTPPDAPRIWLHGASVGESLVNLTLAGALAEARPDLFFLFTSHTGTSARLMAGRLAGGVLAGRSLHQMAPIDTPDIAARFIGHWRPALAIFAEGEIWPNLVRTAHEAGTRLALINARMTDKSIAGWASWAGFAREIIGAFDVILSSDARTALGLSHLLARDIPEPGNLKSAAPPPPVNEALLAALRADLGERPVWLAASTHPGEERFVLETARAIGPGPLLILAPRHPERGAEVAMIARSLGLSLAQRSKDEAPGPDTRVYLADTMGELGLWIRLSRGVYLGGGHAPGLGGHNPIEIMKLGRPLASGRIVYNFEAVFAELEARGAVRFVETPAELAHLVRGWLSGGIALPDLSDWLAELNRPLTATLGALLPLLPPRSGTGHA